MGGGGGGLVGAKIPRAGGLKGARILDFAIYF